MEIFCCVCIQRNIKIRIFTSTPLPPTNLKENFERYCKGNKQKLATKKSHNSAQNHTKKKRFMEDQSLFCEDPDLLYPREQGLSLPTSLEHILILILRNFLFESNITSDFLNQRV